MKTQTTAGCSSVSFCASLRNHIYPVHQGLNCYVLNHLITWRTGKVCSCYRGEESHFHFSYGHYCISSNTSFPIFLSYSVNSSRRNTTVKLNSVNVSLPSAGHQDWNDLLFFWYKLTFFISYCISHSAKGDLYSVILTVDNQVILL